MLSRIRAPQANSNERGTSAMLIAATLVLLIGMAAIAIDVGAGFNERRQDQTAADVGALAGALDFNDPAEASIQAIDLVRRNLTATFTEAEYAQIWASCTDTDRPAGFFPLPTPATWISNGYTAVTTLDCVSQNPSRIRVRVPDQFIDTTFGRVLGIDTLSTSAVAVATVEPAAEGQGILPFAVRGNQGAGEACLKTSSGGTAQPPCDGPAAGSFGTIISPTFGNDLFDPDVVPNCNPNAVLAQNIALGVDHIILEYDTTIKSDFGPGFPIAGNPPPLNTVRVSDATVDECTQPGGPGNPAIATDGVPIDTVLIDTGNVQTPMTDGLVSNATYLSGTRSSRLQDTTFDTRDLRSGAATWTVDREPLWEFFTIDSGTKVSNVYNIGGIGYVACDSASYTGGTLTVLEKAELLTACLQFHEASFPEDSELADDSAAVIFDDSIGTSPRFAWAPRTFHTVFPNGQSFSPVHDFRMVYIGGIWFNCSGGGCGAVFYPDDVDTGTICITPPGSCAALRIDQLSGFVLPLRSVSKDVRDEFPYGTGDADFEPILFE